MADVNEKRFTNVRIQHRTKTSAEWLAFTEAPLKGELCVELNVSEAGSAVSTKIKIGDGHTLFKDLAYVDGKDGTSVTVSNVSESTEDGGDNIVTFSDGKTLTVKNGTKGSQGKSGDKGDKGDKGDPREVVQEVGQSETAVMSQKATTVEINALKNDLSDKLPKSPANWQQWTADEQAVARERIGINNDAELVERITLSESVSSVVREYDTAGVKYNFKAMRIRIINTSGSIITASVLANGVSLTYCQIQNNTYAPILLDCSSGLLNVVSTITTNTDEGARLSIMPRVRTIGYPMKSFKNIKIDGTLSAGTEIEIYGVRA